jgi:hypothetical protein
VVEANFRAIKDAKKELQIPDSVSDKILKKHLMDLFADIVCSFGSFLLVFLLVNYYFVMFVACLNCLNFNFISKA